MKTKLLIILLIPLLHSCYQREDIVTFYGEDTLSKEMMISTVLNEETLNTVHSTVTIDLLESDFFEKYIENLHTLEITSIKVDINGYDQSIVNSKLELGNYLLVDNCFDESGQTDVTFTIKDPILLENISNLLTEQSIPFVFSGECNSSDTFTVSLSITFKGIFGN